MTEINIFLVTIAVLFIGALAFAARRSAKNDDERNLENMCGHRSAARTVRTKAIIGEYDISAVRGSIESKRG